VPWWTRKARQTRAANSNIAAQSIAGLCRTDHHLAVAQALTTPDREAGEVVAARVRRLEALRWAGIVQCEAERF
jgi:hypothetical protein